MLRQKGSSAVTASHSSAFLERSFCRPNACPPDHHQIDADHAFLCDAGTTSHPGALSTDELPFLYLRKAITWCATRATS